MFIQNTEKNVNKISVDTINAIASRKLVAFLDSCLLCVDCLWAWIAVYTVLTVCERDLLSRVCWPSVSVVCCLLFVDRLWAWFIVFCVLTVWEHSLLSAVCWLYVNKFCCMLRVDHLWAWSTVRCVLTDLRQWAWYVVSCVLTVCELGLLSAVCWTVCERPLLYVACFRFVSVVYCILFIDRLRA